MGEMVSHGTGLGWFGERAVSSRLVSEEDVQSCLARLAADQRDDQELLARTLVKRRLLTRWQARKLWNGRTQGFHVGQYKILDVLGVGGMGKVYRAVHTFMDREVALKVLPPQKKKPRAFARFLREVQTSGRLKHPNIVTVYDAGESRVGASDVVYLAMEVVEGHTLFDHVEERGAMPAAAAADVIAQAAEGLAYAHLEGVIHRDVKPQNLMVARDGTVKILDLGIIRLDDSADDDKADDSGNGLSSLQTNPGSVCGTLAYAAPEQALDARRADARSDIFSLGATFYYLLTGRHAFAAKTPYDTLARLAEADPVPLKELDSSIPDPIANIVHRMMHPDPEERPQSADVVADALALWRESPRLAAQETLADAHPLEWLSEPTMAEQAGDEQDPLNWLDDTEPTPGAQQTVGEDSQLASVLDSNAAAPVSDSRSDQSLPFIARAVGVTLGVVAVAIPCFLLMGRPSKSSEKKTDPPAVPPKVTETARPADVINSLGMRLVLIKPGTFQMGADGADPLAAPDEKPLHTVTITKPFYMATREVSQQEYKAVMGDNPSDYAKPGQTGSLPVESVTYNEAVTFCRMLSLSPEEDQRRYTLPSEAQWEYVFKTGFVEPTLEPSYEQKALRRGRDEPESRVRPTGMSEPNAFGIFDLNVNVSEWCRDWYDARYYSQSPPNDPVGPLSGRSRVARGGNNVLPAQQRRATARRPFDPSRRNAYLGFRVIIEVE